MKLFEQQSSAHNHLLKTFSKPRAILQSRVSSCRMKYTSLLYSALLASSSLATPIEQQVLNNELGNAVDARQQIIDRLIAAEIIPDLVANFVPIVNVSVSWKHATAEVGNTIKPKKLQKAPTVELIDWPVSEDEIQDEMLKKWHGTQLTLVLTDPDAPSREDPKWSQFCHWIATGFPLKAATSDDIIQSSKKDYKEIVEYKPPGPPAKTGPHRYVFFALAPLNGTTEKLHLQKPKGRKHWGYDGERPGVREWAVEHGLGVIGANFIYAQNKKQ